jgi:hypothetical protein
MIDSPSQPDVAALTRTAPVTVAASATTTNIRTAPRIPTDVPDTAALLEMGHRNGEGIHRR